MSASATFLRNAVRDSTFLGIAFPVLSSHTIKLYTSVDGSGAPSTEVAGGSYAAQSITWASAGDGAVANTNLIQFNGLPTCSVVAFAIWATPPTASSVMAIYGSLGSPRVVISGDSIYFSIGSIGIQWY